MRTFTEEDLIATAKLLAEKYIRAFYETGYQDGLKDGIAQGRLKQQQEYSDYCERNGVEYAPRTTTINIQNLTINMMED